MCGIVGIWNLDREAVDLAKLQLATNAIRHRGPDDEGYLLVDTRAGRAKSCGGTDTDYRLSLPDLEQFKSERFDLTFGFRRLAILDLSPGGHQPMSSPDGKFWIVFNGEIYNYQELRAELAAHGHNFKTTSDTEVILAAYRQWGEACVEHLNGMFALAIWDSMARKIFVARDRFGEKPFHYVYIPQRLFAFASEMKALWAAGLAGRRIHEETLALFTQHGQVEIGEQTIYEGIQRLPQGHCLTLTAEGTADGHLQKRRYWDIDPRVRIEGWTDQRYAEEFREHFTNSVNLRLRADVPVGSSLSGGLDSSTVVGVINRLLPESAVQKTFSARFDDPSRDEGKWMDLVTNSNRVERHDVWPTAERFFEELSDLFWHQEEPFTSASVYAQWNVMRLAKQNGVTVLLDGQGADEMLAGYHSYFNEMTDDLLNSFDFRGYLKWRRDCLALHGVVPGQFRRVISQKTPEPVKRLLKKGLQKPQVELAEPVYPREFGKVSSLRKLLWWNTTREGLVELLRYADRNSMAHSREVRLPFLDHNLVEFVFKLPERLLVQDGWTKWILREAFRGVVPEEISNRVDKLGYMPPQQKWLGGLAWPDVMMSELSKLTNGAQKEPAATEMALLSS